MDKQLEEQFKLVLKLGLDVNSCSIQYVDLADDAKECLHSFVNTNYVEYDTGSGYATKLLKDMSQFNSASVYRVKVPDSVRQMWFNEQVDPGVDVDEVADVVADVVDRLTDREKLVKDFLALSDLTDRRIRLYDRLEEVRAAEMKWMGKRLADLEEKSKVCSKFEQYSVYVSKLVKDGNQKQIRTFGLWRKSNGID